MAGWNVRPHPGPLPQERGRPWFVAGLTVDGSAHPVARIFKETGDDSSLSPGEVGGVRASVTTIFSTRQFPPNHRYNFFHNISPFLLIKCAWVPFASHPALLSLLHPRHPTAIPNQIF